METILLILFVSALSFTAFSIKWSLDNYVSNLENPDGRDDYWIVGNW